MSFGTGVNFLNYQTGEQLGEHYDTPLWEYDRNYNKLPGFEGRLCYVSVIVALNKDYTGGQLRVLNDGVWTDINTSIGDVFVLHSPEVKHQVKLIESGIRYTLDGFFCGPIG